MIDFPYHMKKEKEASSIALLRPMLKRYLRPHLTMLVFAVLAGVVAAAASGFGLPVMLNSVFPIVFGVQPAPEWLQEIMRNHVPAGRMEVALLAGAAMMIPLVMILRGVATFLNSFLLAKVGVRFSAALRLDVFARLQWLSFSFHDRHQRGQMMTTVLQYTQMLQQQVLQVMNDIVIQPLTLLAALAYLVYAAMTNHESAVLLGNLLITSLSIPLVRMVGRRMVRKMRKMMKEMGSITTSVEETLSAQREVRAFNLELRREDLLLEWIRKFNSSFIKVVAWQASLSPAIEIVASLALAYSLYQGCGDGLTLEQFSAIATAFYFCYEPFKRLGAIMNQVQIMGTMVTEINKILLAEDETPEPKHPLQLPENAAGVVDFEHVTFGYHEDQTVLHDISVHVPAGEVVALVGPSGSGKTTFINLICRFYDPAQGRVCIDGVDVRDLSRETRTKAIGLVSQFSALFRDSIAENIRVGRPGATDEEVRRAGDMACVSEFTESYPEGYGRVLEEGGSGLSGGQRQRVSIARAFLKNAPILILDEATSALDMKSEAKIQGALERLVEGHTTFIIAHRFSTIRMARRILVFNEGRIVADGSHGQLYESCVLYRHLYDEQVRIEQKRKENESC